MEKLEDRVQHCLNFFGKTQAGLARACRIKPSSVHAWLSGKTKRISGENLLRAASYFGVNNEWLATGRGPITSDDHSPIAQEILPMPYVHPHPLVRQVIALMEATDEAGRGIALMAISQALEKYRPIKETLKSSA